MKTLLPRDAIAPAEFDSRVHFGEGTLRLLSESLAHLAVNRVFFVVDEAAYTASNAAAEIEGALAGRQSSRWAGFAPNPKAEDVARGLRLLRDFQADVVLAFGGGTAIDLGKLIAMFAAQRGAIDEFITGKTPLAPTALPLVAIPTTAGTGSEATHFAVVHLEGHKYSVAHSLLLPRVAIVDSLLTQNLPAAITATTGLDAFCQSIESIWAVGATEGSVADAKRSLELSWRHLVSAVLAPTPEDRLRMCEAAHLAGRAINVSKTTAPHALSYRITSKFGVAHGSAVAATLSALLKYNANLTDADCQDPRGTTYVRNRISTILRLVDAADVDDGCRKIEAFVSATGNPASLAAAGITTDDDLHDIIRSVNAERMSNNPRRLDPVELESYLRCAGSAV